MSKKLVPQRDAVRGFGDLIARVRLNGERFTITRFGHPVAVLAPVPDDSAAPSPARKANDNEGRR
jgi:antitoxin (DNA-binding transcriptional repressor) of toxin-antitoxin stability system